MFHFWWFFYFEIKFKQNLFLFLSFAIRCKETRIRSFVLRCERKASMESGDETEWELCFLLLCLQLGFELVPFDLHWFRLAENLENERRMFNFFFFIFSESQKFRVETCSDGDELLLAGVVLEEGQELSLEGLVQFVFDGLFDVGQTNGGRGHLLVTTFGQDDRQTTFQKLGELCDDWVSQCWSHCWWWELWLLLFGEMKLEMNSVWWMKR